ncbi:ABC transporter ATP-binding protein [Embleya scabrispora]|uniref:ABC transporter ATP-binding protein n=1 Tax=Embleya scabrispora TaxID=159449 RepID=UPI0007C4CCC5|nr:ABC transporter ATP-binding protein [Embleya scabrispora]MYS86918.1 dipeptide ABC transporter ATP-binding protein [Streptomyces sp. SID5474]
MSTPQAGSEESSARAGLEDTGTPRATVLDVVGLRVELDSGTPVVEGVSLRLDRGEILGLVGESGCGKTTTALALLGFARPGTRIAGGEVFVAGEDILRLDESDRRRLRGKKVSYVPQDAGQALNPALRIGGSITDVMRRPHEASGNGVGALLTAVDLPGTAEFAARLPHRLSGGQQQRVTIAMALACEPPVVVMDEPTTGLDVITQAGVLDEVRRLRDELGTSLVYVSHDLAVVSRLADRIAVMYAGRIVEEGPTATLLARPEHPYTKGLVQSIPDHTRPSRLTAMPGTALGVEDRPQGCAFAPRCPQRSDACTERMPELSGTGHRVRCVHADRTPPIVPGPPRTARATVERGLLLTVSDLHASHRTGRDAVIAAAGVSFDLGSGECLALVGQSGSGKTTIARCLVGLHRRDGGTVALGGEPLADRVRRRTTDQRRRIQYVFQNPYESLNPRQTVGEQLARPARKLRGLSAAAARAEVGPLLEQVRLPAGIADRYPRRLSGGERQRVAIARALAAGPDVLVCDEITSALDVSVQAAILELLADLRGELGLAMLLITHDLGVVAVAADRVAVLEQGTIRESGAVEDVLHAPEHPYTARLVAAAPTIGRTDGPLAVPDTGKSQT